MGLTTERVSTAQIATAAYNLNRQKANLRACFDLLRGATNKQKIAVITDNIGVAGLRLRGTGLNCNEYDIISSGTTFNPRDYCLVFSTSSNELGHPVVLIDDLTAEGLASAIDRQFDV